MVEFKSPTISVEVVRERVSFDAFYPQEYAAPCSRRTWKELGDGAGLTQFGVNLTTLPPGAWSAQRHWHMNEDEFVYILEGEAVLVTDAGEQVLKPGMAAGFPAGIRNGHHLINKSQSPVTFLEIGTRSKNDDGEYPDIDMKFETRDGVFRTLRKDGGSFQRHFAFGLLWNVYTSKPGGWVSGPKIKGEVVAPTADWLRVAPNGVKTLNVWLSIIVDDGSYIFMQYVGRIAGQERFRKWPKPPTETKCFLISPVFETSSEKYDWLNDVISVGKDITSQDTKEECAMYESFILR